MKFLLIKIRNLLEQEKYRFIFYGLIIGVILGLEVNLYPMKDKPFFWALIGAVLSLIIYLAYTYFAPWLKNTFIRATLSRLLGAMYDGDEECIIFITELKNTEHRLQDYEGKFIVGTDRVVGTGDAMALPYLYNLLIKAGKRHDKISVVKSFDTINEYFNKNFISIGGLTNRVTKMLLKNYRNKFEFFFSDNGNAIIKKYPDNHYQYVEITEDHDYGIITKISNLNHDGKIIFVIAGINDMGTTGAAYYLYDNYEKLVKQFDDGDFSIIIQVSRMIGESSAKKFNFDNDSRECEI